MRGTFLVVVTLLLALHVNGDDQSSKANKVTADNCEVDGIELTDFSDCHDNFPTGCTHAANPSYDAYLNFLKNRVIGSTSPSGAVLTSAGYTHLEGLLPDTLSTRNHAAHAKELATAGEGDVRQLAGFLYYVENEGTQRNGETSNCQMVGTANADFHLGIGFDENVARKIVAGKLHHRANGEDPTIVDQTSVIAEMTPHTRATFHSKWTITRLRKAIGKQVLVRGQLMADNQHFGAQDCGSPSASDVDCWRASIWELHPVTEFFVCETSHCDAADLSQWTALENTN